MSCQQRYGRTTCIDDPHGLTPCTEMVKGFWASSSGTPAFSFQKERARSATRLWLTTLPCESFKNFLNLFERFFVRGWRFEHKSVGTPRCGTGIELRPRCN